MNEEMQIYSLRLIGQAKPGKFRSKEPSPACSDDKAFPHPTVAVAYDDTTCRNVPDFTLGRSEESPFEFNERASVINVSFHLINRTGNIKKPPART